MLSLKSGLASFKKYLPADLVKELIKAGKVAKIGGEEKELAIMFTDIKGFTTISEDNESRRVNFSIIRIFR